MGRKKKCEFSRDNLLKNIENAKESDKLPAKESSKGPTHVTEDSAELEDKWSDEVFEDEDEDQDKEADDDMEELSRLMSIVDIEDDPEELEKQINLAAYQQFLIGLPPALHPAIKGHLTEIFKSLVNFPCSQKLDKFPCITLEINKAKLDLLSEKAGTSFHLVLAPPTYHCLKCGEQLIPQISLATNVMVFELGGPKIATKYRYRCRSCVVANVHLSYHPDQWGAPEYGYMFYGEPCEYVRASRVTWLARAQTEYFFASMHHSWTSQEGNAEIYNEAFINQALKIKASSLPLSGKPDWECRHYLHRKSVSRGLRLYLLERKMRSLNLNWTFPVYSAYDDSAYSEHMTMLDEIRIKEGYVHTCGEFCESQGCIFKGHDMVHAIDGLWKLSYPHCMWYLPNKNLDFNMDIPPVCTSQPHQGSAFCSSHAEIAERIGVPSGLQAFLKHCGVQGGEQYTKEKSKTVESVLQDMHKIAKKSRHVKEADLESSNTPTYDQGTTRILRPRGGLLNSKKISGAQDYVPPCNKDTTGKQRLQKWLRGHCAIVNSAGFIRYWAPMFKSEGPAQIALIVLTFLLTILAPTVPTEDWGKLVLSYDNMCHLDTLRMFKKPLPVKGDLAHIWQRITKVIDELHWRNHVETCQVNWNPKKIREIYPNANLVCCEQTFAWLGRFKKILNQMGKIHHHFFLDCLVERRNLYITRLYEEGRRSLMNIEYEQETDDEADE